MKTSQIVAGALIDFAQSLAQQRGSVNIGVFLREWAADRGLGFDQADVAGWAKSMNPPSLPGAVGSDIGEPLDWLIRINEEALAQEVERQFKQRKRDA